MSSPSSNPAFREDFRRKSLGPAAQLATSAFVWLLASVLRAQTYQVIHSFGPGFYDPESALIADASGNLYGTTRGGGSSGLGTVYRLDAANDYTLTTLHSFAGPEGAHPSAAVIADAAGNLYGTTCEGGPSNLGTVFRLDAANGWALTMLHGFGDFDGSHPSAAVMADAAGNLFGTTRDGGIFGSGTVFELDASKGYALTTLHDFSYFDGAEPYAAVIADAPGNLYGTTGGGGAHGWGTVFRLDTADGYALTTLHDFDGADGASPQAKLLADASGNLYGTTSGGGAYDGGTAFKLDASSNYALTTLWVFSGIFGGPQPRGELIADASGNLYGTTFRGGPWDLGGVYRLDAAFDYGYEPLYDFQGPDGAHPVTGLLADASGNLYGTTRENATVFRLDAASNWTLTTLHYFEGPGTFPMAPLLADAWGNLYGTTSAGGAFGQGTVFRLDAASGYALTSLHDFEGGDGGHPLAGVVADPSGSLYGTTYDGGLGYGTVFKLDRANGYALTTLHAFTGADGSNLRAPLIADGAGNLYGTTYGGGADGYGTIFELDAANGYALTTLHAFGLADGASPVAGLVADAFGNFYGTTQRGGGADAGTVFELDASKGWTLTTLHEFTGPDGYHPSAVIGDASGNLYGTTESGGTDAFGTVFKLDAANGYALTTLYGFTGNLIDGAHPGAPPVMDIAGNLFGTTAAGFLESPGGTIFELDASNGYALTTLYNFFDGNPGVSGASPQAALIVDASGALFGTARVGGPGESGVVFSLATGVPAPLSGITPTSGPSWGGTAVTVTGTGFSSPLTLRIGGALAAGVSVVSSTEITGVTPPLPPGRLNDVEVMNAAAGPSFPFALPGAFFSDFLDVPRADLFHADVEKILRDGITAGCGGGYYCRDNPVTRAQMAVFLLKAEHGSSYVPPPCIGLFADVACMPVPTFAADWIEQLASEGVTVGCGGGNYCPGGSVTRAQMAVLLLKAKHGPSYVPPPCSGLFLDVECTPGPAFAVDWIEELSTEGVTAGCGGGNYCPTNPVSRAQMAAFLVRTFGLP